MGSPRLFCSLVSWARRTAAVQGGGVLFVAPESNIRYKGLISGPGFLAKGQIYQVGGGLLAPEK